MHDVYCTLNFFLLGLSYLDRYINWESFLIPYDVWQTFLSYPMRTDSLAAKDGVSTIVEVTNAKDFALSSFRVAINRCQQAALDKASAPIPCPEDQLAVLHASKKKHRRSILSTGLFFVCLCMFWQILFVWQCHCMIGEKQRSMNKNGWHCI